MFDILIVNGQYPDFQKNKLVNTNVGICDGKIVYIGHELSEAKKIIDASGMVVSPGFIDIHMHEDNFKDDGDYIIANYMLKMGVTTACGGNCGMMNQPLKDFKKEISKRGGSPVNYVMFSGYNQKRYELGLGASDKISDDQIAIIKEAIADDLAEGAIGVSFGIEYDPAITFDEMREAMSVLDKERHLASAHYRASDAAMIDAVKEMIALAESTQCKFQISHIGSGAASGYMDETLKLVNAAIERTKHLLDYDTYPYDAWCTHIGSEVFRPGGGLEVNCKDVGDIMLTEEPYAGVFCTMEILNKVRAEYPEMLAVGYTLDEGEVTKAINNKYGMIGSDGILLKGKGHPRAAGTFPRVLGKYVREEKAISLINALRKMTLAPADRLLLSKKGRIKIGRDADITIFNPQTIIDGATYSNIDVQPEGIEYVIIAGKITMNNKKIINDRQGNFISVQY